MTDHFVVAEELDILTSSASILHSLWKLEQHGSLAELALSECERHPATVEALVSSNGLALTMLNDYQWRDSYCR